MTWIVGWDVVGRVLVAAALGAVIGFERELDDHPAGLRTIMTVAVGAALFGAISTTGFDEYAARRASTNMQVDVTRVASQVVVGIGFLGAGLIFRRGESVINLTTAATLWATAAVGLAAGVGDVGLAVATTAIVTVVLLILPIPQGWAVRHFGRKRRSVWVVPAPGVTVEALREKLTAGDQVEIDIWKLEKADGTLSVTARMASKAGFDLEAHLTALATSDEIAVLEHR